MIVKDFENSFSPGKIWNLTRKVDAKIHPALVVEFNYIAIRIGILR